ncbi:AraC family transcriptional regulator [Mitsuaria sp. 7]|uniref:AraC family transcriptional regulator n=1 Tax=Mitsuaria sp. 7 TaxID=1658665 RepID=UPI0007DCD4A9|nr:AraC family transcriptional regulator [Mitsuaria sp. 7]ANH68357.1 AraC family transcriptional regulator [Mitsuaria sp. 7]
MSTPLLPVVRRYADFYADAQGVAATPLPGFTVLRATSPSELLYAISRPLVAIVVQGTKRVMMGARTFDFGAGDSLLITADVPTISQITGASLVEPYYSLVLDLDPSLIQELAVEMSVAEGDRGTPVRVDPTEPEVSATALRMLELLDRPTAVPVLKRQLVREMHYWLMAGRHGPAIRNLGVSDSRSRQVSKAVALIRSEFARPLRIERLAEAAAMSPSTLHEHFKAVTSLSPLQFQKQLRLIEARRMMMSENAGASDAAYAVGYESVPQFTREYGRMFGASPVRDVKGTRAKIRAV